MDLRPAEGRVADPLQAPWASRVKASSLPLWAYPTTASSLADTPSPTLSYWPPAGSPTLHAPGGAPPERLDASGAVAGPHYDGATFTINVGGQVPEPASLGMRTACAALAIAADRRAA
ncbi:hypothetical protein [Pirellulimonas nuda]|uniref:hypothetical protein n=1 Tax=Pirellulimonas nuda TaxID=2528009 RepID=UPI001E293938|nr:hypothetical protein [Pirellulimonas nuda]